jgi:TatD DNase family protein
MILIDTHCHLYLPEFDNDIDAVLNSASANDVHKIFLPAIDSETTGRMIELCRRSSDRCQLLPMTGLHPCSVNENFEDELMKIEQQLQTDTKYYAIGETGLDYHWDTTHKDLQIISFERQIAFAIEKNLPVVIHSRKSTYDCIKCVKKFEGEAKGVFHCFGGSLEEANEVIKLGFYLGIGGVVTYKNSGLKEVLPQIGLQNIVLETDAPYLTPVPHRGKRNEPSYIKLVAMTIAQILGKSYEEVAEVTSENAERLFQLKV